MPHVLTTRAQILCPHGGLGTSLASNPKWSVEGGLALLEDDVGTLACPFVPYPCIGYRLRSMGLNATRIDSRRVVLVTDFNQSFTGLPLTMTEFHHTLDHTNPAPIPAGQAAPPLSPELADAVEPVVTGAPPALAFNSVTMQPVTAAATFTLTSDHPLRWMLTLINEPMQYNADLTGGLPPGLVVMPPGGAWDAPVLTVTVTMTAAFMAGLGLGRHHFYLTGVSRRGLNGYASLTLTVS